MEVGLVAGCLVGLGVGGGVSCGKVGGVGENVGDEVVGLAVGMDGNTHCEGVGGSASCWLKKPRGMSPHTGVKSCMKLLALLVKPQSELVQEHW